MIFTRSYAPDNSPNTFFSIFCPLSKFKTRNRSSIKCALSLACPIGKLMALALNSLSNHLIPEIVPPLNKSASIFHTKRSLQGGKRGGTSRIYNGSIPHSSLTALSKALNPLFSGSPSHQSALCSTMTDRQLSLPRESKFS